MLATFLATALLGGIHPAPHVPVPSTGVVNGRTVRVAALPTDLTGASVGARFSGLSGTTTGRALRRAILSDLTREGYVPATDGPDFTVHYYLAAPATADVTDDAHLYAFRPVWLRADGPDSIDLTPIEYADGAVVVDLIDAHTGQLLWRGHAPLTPSDDGRVVLKDLRKAVNGVMRQAPSPMGPLPGR